MCERKQQQQQRHTQRKSVLRINFQFFFIFCWMIVTLSENIYAQHTHSWMHIRANNVNYTFFAYRKTTMKPFIEPALFSKSCDRQEKKKRRRKWIKSKFPVNWYERISRKVHWNDPFNGIRDHYNVEYTGLQKVFCIWFQHETAYL